MTLISILSNLALALSLGGQFLLGRKAKIVFPMWIASNVLWEAILDHWNTQQVIMYVVYTGFNIYNWYKWIQDDKKSKAASTDENINAEKATA